MIRRNHCFLMRHIDTITVRCVWYLFVGQGLPVSKGIPTPERLKF